MWSTQDNVLFLKDRDVVFFEIWKRVIKRQVSIVHQSLFRLENIYTYVYKHGAILL
jgi:hypothetical protein